MDSCQILDWLVKACTVHSLLDLSISDKKQTFKILPPDNNAHLFSLSMKPSKNKLECSYFQLFQASLIFVRKERKAIQ